MPAELQNASLFLLFFGAVAGALAVSAPLAVALKIAGESVYKYKVSYFSAFKALFTSSFALIFMFFALMRLGAIGPVSSGIAMQIIGLVVGLVLLSFTTTFFMRAPDGKKPDFALSAVVAAIMQVIFLLIGLAFTSMNLPIKGVYMDPDRFKTVETRT